MSFQIPEKAAEGALVNYKFHALLLKGMEFSFRKFLRIFLEET